MTPIRPLLLVQVEKKKYSGDNVLDNFDMVFVHEIFDKNITDDVITHDSAL